LVDKKLFFAENMELEEAVEKASGKGGLCFGVSRRLGISS
jgi:hypothetical protein